MKNPLCIDASSKASDRELLLAAINVLNKITQEMFDGRVKQAQTDILENREAAENAVLEMKADLVDMVELEYLNLIGEEM